MCTIIVLCVSLPIIKHDMMKGNTISFKVLKKRSPGYEISVIMSLLSFNGLNVIPEIKYK